MSTAFTIREHKRHEDEQIFDLQQLVYPEHPIYRNRDSTRQYWDWRYLRNSEVTSTVYVATTANDGQIIGMRPMSLLRVNVHGEPVTCAFLTAVITHPQYRKQGVFSSLLQRALSDAAKAGAQYAFTFPNNRSRPLYEKKPGWIEVSPLRLAVKVLDWDSVIRLKLRPAFVARALAALGKPFTRCPNTITPPRGCCHLALSTPTNLDASYDQLWTKIAPQFAISGNRSTTFMRWRYMEHPQARYEIIEARDQAEGSLRGYAIIDTQIRYDLVLGLIVDFLTEPGDQEVATALFAQATRRLAERGAMVACCLYPKCRSIKAPLSRCGFSLVPEMINPKRTNFYCKPISPNAPHQDVFFDSNKWYLTWGDTDNA